MPRPTKPATGLAAAIGAGDLVAVRIRFSDATLATLDVIARDEQRTRAAVVRLAVDAWLRSPRRRAVATGDRWVLVRLPRASVAAIDAAVGTETGAREGAILAAIDVRIAKSKKATRTG